MGKRLTKEEWGEIQTVWESGRKTPKQIAIDYGINRTTLRKKACVNKWKKCGSAVREAIEAARKEFAVETGESFKKKADEANRRHIEIYREIQEIGQAYQSLLSTEMACFMNRDASGLKEVQQIISRIELRNRTICMNTLSNMIKEAIRGEREVLGLEGMQSDDGENSLNQLSEAIDRARIESRIIDVTMGHPDDAM